MRRALLLALVLAFPAGAAPRQIWVYTSIYKEFIAPIQAAFEKKHPDISVQVFQGGSEKIQAKVEAELLAGRPLVDVMLTSDPFWVQDLDRRGLVAAKPGQPAVQPNYYSLMVLIAHRDVPAAERPASFKDLADPRFKGKIQMGNPLESGTTFSSVAYLSRKYGWDFFSKLRDNDIASAGGNSTVIQKVESGEKKAGMVLLENALASRKRGSPIEIIYPSDGSIPVPSYQAVMKSSREKEAAFAFADFLLSKEGQQFLLAGYMYSVRPELPPPADARPLADVTRASTPWTPEILQDVSAHSKEIKKKFSQLILE